ncbi:2,5-diketo-D-gluconic acid reductase [Bombiscardovia apis]|uniref:2,5-diketo-D-gluconic acid reductase n=1 Tax=Bombiscardovia apis TaxID=2932182 RepID=A0ABM8BC49_9BIFI|nr:aldo/keto reductase [Bombiscardovia apis]BDR54500.1 2,5-diketo-D-gluconic acid reductase [Bombiscardovia apis]
MDTIALAEHIAIPNVGFGTYQIAPEATKSAVSQAIALGYRSIDTAQAYHNEKEVGQAVIDSGIDRTDLFITSKTMTEGYEKTLASIDESLAKSGLDYFDLMLIHWPNRDNLATYRALEDAHKAGKLRSIGVSNFNSDQLRQLCQQASVLPAIDQIETTVYWQQKKMHPFLKSTGIVHESWSPLARGTDTFSNEPVLHEISSGHGKTMAQVVLRFLTQEGIVVIPRSSNPQHLAQNLDIFDFELTAEEIVQIRELDRSQPINGWPNSMMQERY